MPTADTTVPPDIVALRRGEAVLTALEDESRQKGIVVTYHEGNQVQVESFEDEKAAEEFARSRESQHAIVWPDTEGRVLIV